MKCPKCKKGDLIFYKGVEKESHFKIAKNRKIYKNPFSTIEFDTEREYLECKNMECNQYYSFSLDSEGRIIKNSLWERL